MRVPWRGLRDLGPRRWAGVVELVVLAGLVELALRTVPLPQLTRWVRVPLQLDGTAAPPGRLGDLALTEAEWAGMDTAWRLLRRPPFNPTCLRQALIGGWVLRRHAPRLRIGVAKGPDALQAHAWVEVDGVSLDPEAAARYGMLRPPGASRG